MNGFIFALFCFTICDLTSESNGHGLLNDEAHLRFSRNLNYFLDMSLKRKELQVNKYINLKQVLAKVLG